MQAIRRTLNAARDVASARVVKQFAVAHHLVYFGAVDYQDDEHQLVRGVTASARHQDSHYTVGTANGRDVIVVYRRNRVTYPGHVARDYSWLIMQFDLKRHDIPRLFIDAKRHDDTFYANLSVMTPKLEDATAVIVPHEHKFAKAFRILCAPTDIELATRVLHEQALDMLASHFKHFDFELNGDTLFVYARASHPQRAVLDDMLRVGLWLADHIDA